MNTGQHIHEEKCAQLFLNSGGNLQNEDWKIQRAEDRFRNLESRTRWEFVVVQASDESRWSALEVKCLVVPRIERQNNDWRKLVAEVNGILEGELTGKYLLAGLPEYTFNRRQKQELVSCLAQFMRQNASNLRSGERRDVGPELARLFEGWPEDKRKQPSIDLVNQSWSYPPHELILHKRTDRGSELKIGIYPFVMYWSAMELRRTVFDILSKCQANVQLALAKNMGASSTVLLLDDHVDFGPQEVTRTIGMIDPSKLSNIDKVYLMSFWSGQHIEQVWPGST